MTAHAPSETDESAVTKAMIDAAFKVCPRDAALELGTGAMQRMIAAAISASPAATKQPSVDLKVMKLSDGRSDYFVSIQQGDREVTPHVFGEEYKAAYHVSLYRWLLCGSEEPDIIAFGPDEWPAIASTTDPTSAGNAEALENDHTFHRIAALRRELKHCGGSMEADIRLDRIEAAYSAALTAKCPPAFARTQQDARQELKQLYKAYVSLIELGRDRIVTAGGTCDPVDVMEKGDPALVRARAFLASATAP